MKFAIVLAVAALATGAGFYAAQEMPEFPKPEKEHEWLKQLAGEWDADSEMMMDPSKPPTKNKGTESSRMIGGFWLQAENKADFMGSPFTGILTLGYDAEKKTYVGTWIDSMTGYMWHYKGAVDAAGKKLTLDTTGPGMDGKPCKFQEILEVKDKDHKIFTSTIEKDGKFVTHMTINYTRKK